MTFGLSYKPGRAGGGGVADLYRDVPLDRVNRRRFCCCHALTADRRPRIAGA